MAANAVVPAPPADFERWFAEHHDLVFRAAWRVTGNAEDSEDVLQTVFMRLLRHSGAPISNVRAYLHRAAVNAALDLVRARRDSSSVPLEVVEPVLSDDSRLRPDRRQDARELRSVLRRAIRRLSASAAEIFVLRYFEGYSNPEIASMVGSSDIAVSVSLHRTRAKLGQEIRSYLGETS